MDLPELSRQKRKISGTKKFLFPQAVYGVYRIHFEINGDPSWIFAL